MYLRQNHATTVARLVFRLRLNDLRSRGISTTFLIFNERTDHGQAAVSPDQIPLANIFVRSGLIFFKRMQAGRAAPFFPGKPNFIAPDVIKIQQVQLMSRHNQLTMHTFGAGKKKESGLIMR